jgi:A/G-specific adenine glycosylase
VDGNVLRVIARVTADETPVDLPAYKKDVSAALAEVYPSAAGDFTQALMELGATVCIPNGKPLCEMCPCRDFCKAKAMGISQELPIRLPKKGRREEEKTVLIFSAQDRYALVKRPEKGLLAGLWQFPELPGTMELDDVLHAVGKMDLVVKDVYRQVDKKHIFTHIEWKMRGFYLEVTEENEIFTWLTREQIENDAALPTAFRQFWER